MATSPTPTRGLVPPLILPPAPPPDEGMEIPSELEPLSHDMTMLSGDLSFDPAREQTKDQFNFPLKSSEFPFLEWVKQEILVMFDECSKKNENFICDVVGASPAVFQDFELALQYKIRAFQKSKDPKELIAFLQHGKETAEKYGFTDENYQLYCGFMDAIKDPNCDFSKVKCRLVRDPSERLTETQKFELAVQSYENLAGNVFRFYQLLNRSCDLYVAKTKASVPMDKRGFADIVLPIQLIASMLNANEELSVWEKYDIAKAILRIYSQMQAQVEVFDDVCNRTLLRDIKNRYASTIITTSYDQEGDSEYAFDLSSFDVARVVLPKPDFDKRKHVLANRGLYQQFLPRIREARSAFQSLAKELSGYCLLLKDVTLYSRFGSFAGLKMRMNRKLTPKQLEKAILEETIAFSKNELKNPAILAQVPGFLMKYKMVKDFREYFSLNEVHFRTLLELDDAVLSGPLELAKQYSADLFLQEKKKRTVPDLPKQKSETVSSVSSKMEVTQGIQSNSSHPLETIPLEEEEEVQELETEPAIAASVPAAPVSLQEQLDLARKLSEKSFSELKKRCEGMGTSAALSNAESHFEDLLCSLQRQSNQLDRPMTRGAVQAFVIDCVRHSALGVEQLLSALDRESNQIKTESELKKRLTHDLGYLLDNCDLKAGEMPQSLRLWIRDARKAQIWVRNLGDCRVGRNPVKTMLALTRFFAEGKDSFVDQRTVSQPLKADVPIRLAIEFAQKAIRVCENVQFQIESSKSNPSQSQKDASRTFKEAFLASCQTLWQKCSNAQHSSASVGAVTGLENKLRDLFKAKRPQTGVYNEFEYLTDNIMGNLIPHLGVEMDAHLALEPWEANLHLGNVLLLDQMIAEETLRALISVLKPGEDISRNEHDLQSLLKKLGVDLKAFSEHEVAFLTQGRAARAAVRYNAGQMQSGIGKTVMKAKSTSQKQKFSQSYKLEKGEKIINPAFDKIKKKASEDVALLKSVLDVIIRQIQ
ncbi:MAG: hypothetical protein JSS60_05640 [Verrucomicrobia bacterium]|nr:hypothetical protein [Verrucomicrobiota bacterium]